MLWNVLAQFVFRLSFGMAIAMWITPASLVTAGFFRVHCWVLLGINTFAVLMAVTSPQLFVWPQAVIAVAVASALFSYVTAVVWLYELPRPGKLLLMVLTALGVAGASFIPLAVEAIPPGDLLVNAASNLSSGLLLGSTMMAMLLGHWYLNTPGMKLAPLKRLLMLMAVAVLIRSLVSGAGVWESLSQAVAADNSFLPLLALRWLAGLIGIGVLTAMTWRTLEIPNTQSATGILYVAVIFAFLGELTSQLLMSQTALPL